MAELPYCPLKGYRAPGAPKFPTKEPEGRKYQDEMNSWGWGSVYGEAEIPEVSVVRLGGLEPPTPRLGISCSVRLSYRRPASILQLPCFVPIAGFSDIRPLAVKE